MRVDVSEVKTFRECKRKHQFSSRNRFHLRPKTPNDNLIFGTQFHEVLHSMYLGTTLDKILEWINNEVVDSVLWKVMDNMATGYYNGPYQTDKDKYAVIDIEKSFNYPLAPVDNNFVNYHAELIDDKWVAIDNETGEICDMICACGSIDMVAVDTDTGELVGFEHKTAKNFRPEVYDLVDEQPRLYSWALKQILEDYHKQGKLLDIDKTGPIFLNQVKKLSSKFDYHRSVCKYSDEDLNNFMKGFIESARQINEGKDTSVLPEPGFMKCQMCDYADLCMHYGYEHIEKQELLKEFEDAFEERDIDHLDEKTERMVNND